MVTDDKVRAEVQHEVARQALKVIAQKAKARDTLTYQSLARDLGRSPTHARAMAQVCDLLDASATLARRPHMALWTVRNASHEINPMAWVKGGLPGLRELLIAEAANYTFSDADEEGIRYALIQLKGMGNKRAWAHVGNIISPEEMIAQLQGRKWSPDMDSLNDLGTDEPPVATTAGQHYVRDMAVRAAVMKRAAGNCEFCGEPGFKRSDGSLYLESHHIIALSNDGKDRMTNVIALCPGHHREAHFGERSVEMEKQMVVIVRKKEPGSSKQ